MNTSDQTLNPLRDGARQSGRGAAWCDRCMAERPDVQSVEAGNFVLPGRVPLCKGCRDEFDRRSRSRGFKDRADERAHRRATLKL